MVCWPSGWFAVLQIKWLIIILGVIVDMPDFEEQCATYNLPCVKNCYFPHAGDISAEHLRSSSVSNVIKASNGFLNGSLFGVCYNSKHHKAIVANRIT